jgi:hypothetical protein
MQTPPTPTTLVAQHTETGQRLTIGHSPLEALRALSEARRLCCPHCQGALVLKAGAVRVHHFAHVSADSCASADHEPETDEHRQGKLHLYHQFREGATAASLEQHLPATDQRADVLITVAGQRYALEFQQANNQAARWLARHAMYRDQGVADVWFLGQVRYQPAEALTPISTFEPLPVPPDVYEAATAAFRVREMEKAMLTVDPVLRYLDPERGLLTVLLARELHANVLRAYQYRLPLRDCTLHEGRLHTPLDRLLTEYWAYWAYQRARSKLSKLR